MTERKSHIEDSENKHQNQFQRLRTLNVIINKDFMQLYPCYKFIKVIQEFLIVQMIELCFEQLKNITEKLLIKNLTFHNLSAV